MRLMRLAGWVLVAMFGGAVALIGQHFIFPVPKVVTGEVATLKRLRRMCLLKTLMSYQARHCWTRRRRVSSP